MAMKVSLPEDPKMSALKWVDYFKLVWPTLRKSLVKLVMLRFLPRVIAGPWGWAVTTVFSWSLDHVLKPIYDYSVRKVIVLVRKKENNQAGQDVQNSTTEPDFNSSVDDLP